MFLFETIALLMCLLGVGFVHARQAWVPRSCPRCRLPGERTLERTVTYAGAIDVFETSLAAPLRLVTLQATGTSGAERTQGAQVPARVPDRVVRQAVQRRETLVAHECRFCRHGWTTAEVELVHADRPEALVVSPQSNVRVFPGLRR